MGKIKSKSRGMAAEARVHAKSMNFSNCRRLRMQYLAGSRETMGDDLWAFPVVDAARLSGRDWLHVLNC